ncbi:MAG TPA: tetratricopeptide repeat protein [Candidatus Krumholzibacteria bacterium]|nr:tetratricopeptide repeat protein [Candidatus Krumholzibacteria bacterium]
MARTRRAAGYGMILALLVLAPIARAQGGAPASPLAQAEELLDKNQPKQAVELAKKAVAQEPNNPSAWFVLARANHAAGDLNGAIAAGHKAAEFAPVRASAFYNLACAYAVKGDKDDAFKALSGAKRAGFADRDQMASDPDLASLRTDPRFQLPLERNYFTLKLTDAATLPFSVDLPVGYEPGRAYPVLIAPGHGKKVEGNWGGLFWGEDTSQRGWITVESPALLTADAVDVTAQLLDEVARRYQVEGGKFHLACYGPSSGPAFGVAMAHSLRIKSLVAIPGFPTTEKPEELKTLGGIRVLFIVGEKDTIWRPQVEVAHARLQQLGVDSYLEVVPGAGHLLQEMFGGELAERLQLLR